MGDRGARRLTDMCLVVCGFTRGGVGGGLSRAQSAEYNCRGPAIRRPALLNNH